MIVKDQYNVAASTVIIVIHNYFFLLLIFFPIFFFLFVIFFREFHGEKNIFFAVLIFTHLRRGSTFFSFFVFDNDPKGSLAASFAFPFLLFSVFFRFVDEISFPQLFYFPRLASTTTFFFFFFFYGYGVYIICYVYRR